MHIKKMVGSERGFTLVELIMVIVLLATISIAIIPKIDIDSMNIGTAAEVVASDIVATQQVAMSTHQSFAVTFSAGSYTYGNGKTRTLSEISLDSVASTVSTITFNSMGEPIEIYAVPPTIPPPATITITSGSSTKQITIQPYTGKATIL